MTKKIFGCDRFMVKVNGVVVRVCYNPMDAEYEMAFMAEELRKENHIARIECVRSKRVAMCENADYANIARPRARFKVQRSIA